MSDQGGFLDADGLLKAHVAEIERLRTKLEKEHARGWRSALDLTSSLIAIRLEKVNQRLRAFPDATWAAAAYELKFAADMIRAEMNQPRQEDDKEAK